jgi:predicted GNAT family acetyltransferase
VSANPADGLSLEFSTDPGEFLDTAGGYLAADPLVSTVVTTVADRARAQQAAGVPQPERDWWLVVRGGGDAVVGAAMRTAPFAPYPLFLLPMPEEAATALATALHERGEEVSAVNGALPAAERCAAELARLTGGKLVVAQHTRLHVLEQLVQPERVPGRLVAATQAHADLVMEWLTAFMGDADEQAGRPRGSSPHELDPHTVARRLDAGELWFWVDDAGRPVHLTAVNPASFGVSRVGPVYTPPEHRGHGWASNAVAEVSRRVQAEGVRVCLFTDQANPTSNKLYAALGYRPVVDMANLLVIR